MASQNFIESKSRQLESQIYRQVPCQLLSEGKDRYSNWKSNGCKWTENDYNHQGFRAAYFERLFYTRAKLVYKVFKHCYKCRLLSASIFREDLNVISIGCGPGCDLLGFQHFYQKMKKKHIKKLKRRVKRLRASHQHVNKHKLRKKIDHNKSMIREIRNAMSSYTGYDTASGWMEYVHSLGYTFKNQRIDKSFVDTMQPVDVAILCYFAHSANLQQRICNNLAFWESLKRKCKVVLVLDTVYKWEEFNGILKEQGFIGLHKLMDNEGRSVYTSFFSA